MAAPKNIVTKSPQVVGKEVFFVRVSVTQDSSDAMDARGYNVVEVQLREDNINALSTAQKTELRALTIGDLLDASFGTSLIDKV
ncbi:MAG: hypothetical protein QW838_02860 [Candidatus Nitrosotenuis sp.]